MPVGGSILLAMPRVSLTRFVTWSALVLAVSGCSSQQTGPASDLARQFYTAVAARDGTAACRALAPKTLSELEQSADKPCSEAVLEEDLPDVDDPKTVHVFGTMAQVRFANDTAFLSRFAAGWKVTAAGCVPQADGLYECQVKGS